MIRSCSWKKAYSGAVVVHVAVFALICMLSPQAPTGGSGMITVELGGPAGEAGGLGDKKIQGQKGSAGGNGDGARMHDKDRKLRHTETDNNKAAAKQNGENVPDPVTRAKSQKPEIAAPQASSSERKSTHSTVHETGEVRMTDKKSRAATTHNRSQNNKSASTKKDTIKTMTDHKDRRPAQTPAPEGEKTVRTFAEGTDGTAKRISAGAGGAIGSSGSADGKSDRPGSGVGEMLGDEVGSGRFIANGDGSYTAKGSGGISYRILNNANPRFPSQARAIGYNRKVRVRVRFLVGLNGKVESMELLTKGIPDLGFKEAALEAVRQMQFEPIYYKKVNIKVYFVKSIIFEP